MENLVKKALNLTNISSDIEEVLKQSKVPLDSDIVDLINTSAEKIFGQYISNEKVLGEIVQFLESSAAKTWLEQEPLIMRDIEKMVMAHVALHGSTRVLSDMGLLNAPSEKIQ